jgi:MFS family permease
MTYGIFQEYYQTHWTFKGGKSAVGIIGTTSNGVMYLSMPFLFAGLSRRWAHRRRLSAFAGVTLSALGFFLSSYSTTVWQLIVTQGIMVAFGCVLMYSPITLSLSEHFSANNRALAYGVVLSSKNITGTVCPFIMQGLLERYGFRTAIRAWMGIATGIGLLAVCLMPMDRFDPDAVRQRHRKLPWHFLHHRTFYIYTVAIILQSSGYGISQTYLNSYAQSVAGLSATNSTLLLALYNIPGIISCSFFGLLSDNRKRPLSANATTCISSLPAALAALLLWGMAGPSRHSMALLTLYSLIYGFFASGYSATWGGVIKEMEQDAVTNNEAIDVGMVYGLLNGARGVGYVTGGIAGVQLLKAGDHVTLGGYAYSTQYAPLILFTGFSTLAGGWSVVFRLHSSNTRSTLKKFRGLMAHQQPLRALGHWIGR